MRAFSSIMISLKAKSTLGFIKNSTIGSSISCLIFCSNYLFFYVKILLHICGGTCIHSLKKLVYKSIDSI